MFTKSIYLAKKVGKCWTNHGLLPKSFETVSSKSSDDPQEFLYLYQEEIKFHNINDDGALLKKVVNCEDERIFICQDKNAVLFVEIRLGVNILG